MKGKWSVCYLWWGRKRRKKLTLHLNCLQISRDDCCSFLRLTGFYQIQKGWTRKKKPKQVQLDHTQGVIWRPIIGGRASTQTFPSPGPDSTSISVSTSQLLASQGWFTGCCYRTRSVKYRQEPQWTFCSQSTTCWYVMIDLDSLSFKIYLIFFFFFFSTTL